MPNQKKSKKLKHNKKRNTAFLFEALVKELTKASIASDTDQRVAISKVLKKHFKKSGILFQELDLYRSVNEARDTDRITAERILLEAKRMYSTLSNDDIFSAQSALVDDINKEVGDSTYANFVPNYKNLATLSQIFSDGIRMKDRVLLENKIICNMIKDNERPDQMHHISNLTYKTFTNKFNESYSEELHEEQKDLLSKYILSFVDNGLELKTYLNEEIGRLKEEVSSSKEAEEINTDTNMVQNTDKVLEILESFAQEMVDEDQIRKILKIQDLVREVNS
jgi:hypothetical protein